MHGRSQRSSVLGGAAPAAILGWPPPKGAPAPSPHHELDAGSCVVGPPAARSHAARAARRAGALALAIATALALAWRRPRRLVLQVLLRDGYEAIGSPWEMVYLNGSGGGDYWAKGKQGELPGYRSSVLLVELGRGHAVVDALDHLLGDRDCSGITKSKKRADTQGWLRQRTYRGRRTCRSGRSRAS